ncbi:MAG: alpha/beta hydrolase [Actinomycetota bacterium]
MPTTEDVTFAGVLGNELTGVLHRPDERAKGSVLLAHCFTCSKDLHTMTRLAKGLAEHGYAAFRYDFTGLGESEGSFAESTVGTDVRDLTRAATTLIEMGFGPCGMLGHSLGGAATLLAAARLRTVRSVAVLAAPSDPEHVTHLFSDAVESDAACVEVSIGGRPFPITRSFIDDLAAHDSDQAIAELGRPLLVVHPVDDEIVPVSEGERIFQLARQPKAFVPLLDSDHLVTPRAAADRALEIVVDWFDSTL